MTATPTPAAHLCAAVSAVMAHAIDHDLSAPWAIYPTVHGVELQVPTGTYKAWTDTLVISEETGIPAGADARLIHGGPARRWTAEGVLPATGVRVTVRGLMVAGQAVAS